MNKGLTLIETILYIALLTILIVTALPLLADMNLWQSSQKFVNTATRDYIFLSGKVRFLAQKSTRVIVPRVGEYSDILEIDTENEGVLTLKIENGLVLAYEEEAEPRPLLASTTNVERLTFYRPAGDGPTRILFNVSIDGFDFSTTSYPFRDE